MMDQAIRDFTKQFSYQPVIENKDQLGVFSKYVVLGMGGSHLAADVLISVDPSIDCIIHRNYELPAIDLTDRLIIASSYSGNTEEVIDGLNQAIEKKLPVAVIAVGGTLIELAKENNLPYIQLPNTGIQPRSALGFSFLALVAIMGRTDLQAQAADVQKLDTEALRQEGYELAHQCQGKVPVIYASEQNFAVGYNWKIKLNETGKIPAFCNVFPELNHNEMAGFDVGTSARGLVENFTFIFLSDVNDHPRVQKRMRISQAQLEERGHTVITKSLTGSHRLESIFRSLLVADWFAFETALLYGHEPEQVPIIEAFKKLMAQ